MKDIDYKRSTYKEIYDHIHDISIPYKKQNQGLILFDLWEEYIKTSHNILDIGCGNGKLCDFLSDKGYRITGIDISTGNYDRKKYIFFQQDITLPIWNLDTSVFDISFCFDVLEHLEEKHIKPFLNIFFNIGNMQIFSIAHYNVSKGLHKTVHPLDWWIDILGKNIFIIKRIERGKNKNVTLLLKKDTLI